MAKFVKGKVHNLWYETDGLYLLNSELYDEVSPGPRYSFGKAQPQMIARPSVRDKWR